jgi:tetratricopeptide (TPR) repeat protein
MRVWLFTLLALPALLAADSQQIALSLKAQSDFDRVVLSAVPPLHDTIGCTQSQAALLPVALPADTALIQYRLGYCELAGATLSHDPAGFATAASAFAKAIQAWPARFKDKEKTVLPEPVSSGLQALSAVARLQAGGDDAALAKARQDLAFALQAPTCLSNFMPANRCERLLNLGREWLGYLALRDGDLAGADRNFQPATAPGWVAWTFAKQAFERGSYAQAAGDYKRAVEIWNSKRDPAELALIERISPQPDMASAYTELGGAQLLAGSPNDAIASLTRAIKERPTEARPYYLRARAKEAAGQPAEALADYNMASRTAFASAKDLASGEAHLYRGILLYRRKDFPHAEDEFASAMNFDIPAALKVDAEAWRHLAAVASGSCAASRQFLEQTLPRVTPYFPRAEARAAVAGCPSLASAGHYSTAQ